MSVSSIYLIYVFMLCIFRILCLLWLMSLIKNVKHLASGVFALAHLCVTLSIFMFIHINIQRNHLHCCCFLLLPYIHFNCGKFHLSLSVAQLNNEI